MNLTKREAKRWNWSGKMPAKPTRTSMKRRADRMFSLFIRERDGKCVNCGGEVSALRGILPSMDITRVSYTESGRAYVMGHNKKPNGGSYPRRHYGIVARCPSCNVEFFRYERGRQRFCSISCSRLGRLNPMWKGGRSRSPAGYVWLRAGNGKVLEHRYVMEQHLGRFLERWEHVHHRNGVKDDNRISNLQIVTHARPNGVVICPHCRRDFEVH